MCRRLKAIHPAVMLFTFAAGVAVNLCFSESVCFHESGGAPTRPRPPAGVTPQKPLKRPEVSLKCESRALRQLWNEVIKDETFRSYFAGGDTFDCSKDFSWKSVDLNRDRTPEVVLQGSGLQLCSPTGNCPLWVFGKTGEGYRLLLATDAVQMYEFRGGRSKGYRDLITKSHDSAVDSEWTLFRYDGERYRPEECTIHSYSFLDGRGEVRIRKNAKVTPVLCDRD